MRLISFVVLGCVLVTPASGRAAPGPQQPPPATTVRLTITGGFLGKLDGFPDMPGSDLDVIDPPCPAGTPFCHLGGVLALRDWLRADTARASRWLLLTGNNRPNLVSHIYARALDSTETGPFVQRMRTGVQELNQAPTVAPEFWQEVARLEPKVIAIGRDDILRSLWSLGGRFGDDARGSGEAFVASLTTSRPYKDAPFLLSNGVVRRWTGRKPGKLDDPFSSEGGRPLVEWGRGVSPREPFALFDLQGRPLASATEGPAIGVVAFAGPDALKLAGPTRRSWTLANGEQAELALLEPTAAMEAIKDRTRALGVAPLWIVLADVNDAGIIELMNDHPDIRVMILPPESGLLGRGAPVVENTFSGDLGHYGVIDREPAQLTRLMLRPEWIGETVIEADAVLTPGLRWRLDHPAISVTTLRGYELEGRSLPDGRVRYEAISPWTGTATPLGVEDLLPPPAAGSCDALSRVWTTGEGFRAMLADAVHRQFGADIVVIPSEDLEPGFSAWLASKGDPRRWQSLRVIDEILYRSHRYAKVPVAASDLVKTLEKLKKLRPGLAPLFYGVTDRDGEPFDKEGALAPATIAVQGRQLTRGHFYRVAMPAYLADEAGLGGDQDDDETGGLFRLMVDRLQHPPEKTRADLEMEPRPCLARALNARLQSYASVDKLSVGAGQTKIAESDFPVDVATLPVAAAGSKEQVTGTLALRADLGLLDAPRWALRVQAESDLKGSELRTATTTSIDRDESRIGLRGDWKWARSGYGLRAFAGGSLEGQFFERKLETEPTRDEEVTVVSSGATTTVSMKGPKLPYSIPPSNYVYGELGAELTTVVGLKGIDQLTAALRRQWGRSHIPEYATLDGVRLEGLILTEKGISQAVQKRFRAGDVLLPDSQIHVHLQDRTQHRWQLDSLGTIKPKIDWLPEALTIDWDVRLRWYDYEVALLPYALSSTSQFVLKLKIPFWRRLTVGPEWNGVRVGINVPPESAGARSAWVHQLALTVDWPLFVKLGPARFIR